VVLDVDSWTSRRPDAAGTTPNAAWLQQRGWKAADLSRTGSLQTAWQELGR